MFSIVRTFNSADTDRRFAVVVESTDERRAVLLALVLVATAMLSEHTTAYAVYDEYTHLVDVNKHNRVFIAAEYNIKLASVDQQVRKG